MSNALKPRKPLAAILPVAKLPKSPLSLVKRLESEKKGLRKEVDMLNRVELRIERLEEERDERVARVAAKQARVEQVEEALTESKGKVQADLAKLEEKRAKLLALLDN